MIFCVEALLLVLQISLFLLGRLCDDLSWHDVGINNEQNALSGISMTALTITVIIKLI